MYNIAIIIAQVYVRTARSKKICGLAFFFFFLLSSGDLPRDSVVSCDARLHVNLLRFLARRAMFHLQPTGTCGASMSSGKRPRGACQGPQVSQPAIGPEIGSTVVVAAVRSSATTTVGMIGGVQVEMMLDSGSSISLVRSDILSQTNITRIQAPRQIQLRTASGAELPIVDHGRMQVTLGELNLWHDFAIVDSLVVPVILGVDFLQEKELVLDFTQRPVGICLAKSSPQMDTLQVPMYSEERKMQAKACAITVLDKPDSDIVNVSWALFPTIGDTFPTLPTLQLLLMN